MSKARDNAVQPVNPFTPASALAAAQELKRYLDYWHFDSPDEPSQWLTSFESRQMLGTTFAHLLEANRVSTPKRPVATYSKARKAP